MSPRNGSDRRGQDISYDRDPSYRGAAPLENRQDPLKLDYLVTYPQFVLFTRGAHARTHGRNSVLTQEELDRKYENYRESFLRKQNEKLFKAHKDQEWFREKYHPVDSAIFMATVHLQRANLFTRFNTLLASGKFDSLSFDEPATAIAEGASGDTFSIKTGEDTVTDGLDDTKPDIMSTDMKEEDPESLTKMDQDRNDMEAVVDESAGTLPVRHDAAVKASTTTSTAAHMTSSTDATHTDVVNESALFIKGVSLSTKRSDIIEVCQKVDGFKYLALTDPRVDKKMSRLGWVVFEDSTDLSKALEILDNTTAGGQTIHLAINQTVVKRQHALPMEMCRPERLLQDLELAKKLAIVLDSECKFLEGMGLPVVEAYLDSRYGLFEPYSKAEPIVEEEVDGEVQEENDTLQVESIKRRLDLYVEYMRQVHCYDYYSGVEAATPEDFIRRTMVHMRRPYVASKDASLDTTTVGGMLGGSGGPTTWTARRDNFMARLDQRIQIRLAPPTEGPLLVKMGGKPVEDDVEVYLGTNISKEAESKFRCALCSKLFKGDDYARKHIRGKHAGPVEEIIAELTFFNTFALDCNKLDMSRQPLNIVGGMMAANNGHGIMGMNAWMPPYGGGLGVGLVGDRTGGYDREREYRGGGDRDRRDGGRVWSGMDYPRDEFGRRMDYGGDRNGGGSNVRPIIRRPDLRPMIPSRVPPPSQSGRRPDSRQIRTYHDLDAPASGDIELKYD
ncbi:hypothetical protein BSLG_004803 [Batrachochytrium salamandrivorans]|nr:hypothetical protein BSLG_004803 [Batrachochytrium salamandrivorans]